MKQKNSSEKHLNPTNRLLLLFVSVFVLVFAVNFADIADNVSATESEQISQSENSIHGAQTVSVSEGISPPWWMPNIVIPLIMLSAIIVAGILILAVSAAVSHLVQNRRSVAS